MREVFLAVAHSGQSRSEASRREGLTARTTAYARARGKGDLEKMWQKESPDSREGAGVGLDRQAATASGCAAFALATSLRMARARISYAFIVTVTMSPPLTWRSRSYWLVSSSPSTRT